MPLFRLTLVTLFARKAWFFVIFAVLLLGIIYIFRQVITLGPELKWLDRVRKESSGGLIFPGAAAQDKPPRLLGHLAVGGVGIVAQLAHGAQDRDPSIGFE